MAKYAFAKTVQDIGSLANRLAQWLRGKGFATDITSHGNARAISAKKTGGLRELAGMSTTMKVVCESLEAENMVVLEIEREISQDSLAKAAVIGFFSAGATWATAGVAANQAKALEEDVVAQVEAWLSCKRLPASAAIPKNESAGLSSATGEHNKDGAEALASAAEMSGKAVTAATGMLLGFADALATVGASVGKAVGEALTFKCPKCKQPLKTADYTKTRIHLNRHEEVGRAYRTPSGKIMDTNLFTQGCIEIQAVYHVYMETVEWQCKKCGHKWQETKTTKLLP